MSSSFLSQISHSPFPLPGGSAYTDVNTKGTHFHGEPFEPTLMIRLAFLREPNGAVIELVQRDRKVMEKALVKGDVNW